VLPLQLTLEHIISAKIGQHIYMIPEKTPQYYFEGNHYAGSGQTKDEHNKNDCVTTM
jgi:hypothetical protein